MGLPEDIREKQPGSIGFSSSDSSAPPPSAKHRQNEDYLIVQLAKTCISQDPIDQSGIPVYCFKDPVSQAYICTICHKCFHCAVITIPCCQQTFCRGCIIQHLEAHQGTCLCGQPLTPDQLIENKQLNAAIGELTLTCPSCRAWEGPCASLLSQHRIGGDCMARPVEEPLSAACPFGCGARVLPNDLERHIGENVGSHLLAMYRITQAMYIPQTVSKEELQQAVRNMRDVHKANKEELRQRMQMHSSDEQLTARLERMEASHQRAMNFMRDLMLHHLQSTSQDARKTLSDLRLICPCDFCRFPIEMQGLLCHDLSFAQFARLRALSKCWDLRYREFGPGAGIIAWGRNNCGQLGNGSRADQTSPRVLDSDGPFASLRPHRITGGSNHTLALTPQGEVFAWGLNNGGQLGDNTTVNKGAPVRVGGDLIGKRVVKIDCGWSHSMALTDQGEVYTWGWNFHGCVTGLADSPHQLTHYTRPHRVEGLSSHRVVKIATGESSTYALCANGEVYVWGCNEGDCLGTGLGKKSVGVIRVKCPCVRDVSRVQLCVGGRVGMMYISEK
eukprot:gnl/Trimastix_PCT/4363.p1 GENE.gnl/Trimastix_PCT/4363~~gnl/Trimastix_PCT/4363.p1  ORF type:complete len:559 (+),score=28.70 gnl/Trimastix_PCT/4363:386-2062(+)